jgi:hypothetical protein
MGLSSYQLRLTIPDRRYHAIHDDDRADRERDADARRNDDRIGFGVAAWRLPLG